MSSGRLLLLGVAFALWSPLLSFPGGYIRWCITLPDYSRQCGEPEERFFYNITSMSCEPFYFFGCPGNPNNFGTARECHLFCNFCQLPPEKGPCDYKTERWFYDPKTKDCKAFTFGGCGGNFNNFNRYRACWKTCHNRGSP